GRRPAGRGRRRRPRPLGERARPAPHPRGHAPRRREPEAQPRAGGAGRDQLARADAGGRRRRAAGRAAGGDRGPARRPEGGLPVTRGVLATPHFLATEAGAAILRDGGNAVDAAVAASAVLSVVYPQMT